MKNRCGEVTKNFKHFFSKMKPLICLPIFPELPTQQPSSLQKPKKRRKRSNKLHLCPIQGCNKGYQSNQRLKYHLNTHSGIKPYICEFPSKKRYFHPKIFFKKFMKMTI